MDQHEQVIRYIGDKYKPVDDRLVPFRMVCEKGKVPIIRKETELFLNMLIDLYKPSKIFEIGTAIGYSSAFFAISAPDSVIYTVEKDEYAYNAAKKNIDNAGVSDRVNLFLGDGQMIAEKLRDSNVNDFDLIFIDAGKTHYRRFLDSALEIARPGAIIISDDIMQHGMTANDAFDPKGKHKTNIAAMRDYVDHLLRYDKFRTTILSIGDGIAVTRYLGNIR